jgi:hypothetical protein
VAGAYRTTVGGTYAKLDTSRVNPRLFLLVLAIGLAILAARGPALVHVREIASTLLRSWP